MTAEFVAWLAEAGIRAEPADTTMPRAECPVCSALVPSGPLPGTRLVQVVFHAHRTKGSQCIGSAMLVRPREER